MNHFPFLFVLFIPQPLFATMAWSLAANGRVVAVVAQQDCSGAMRQWEVAMPSPLQGQTTL